MSNRLSVADLQVVYLTEGVEGVSALIDGNHRLATLKKAESQLCARGVDTAPLMALIKNLSPEAGKKGKTPLLSGSRSFTVQQNAKTGSHFVVVPVEALRLEKGRKVKVTVDFERLVVTAIAE